MKAAGADFLLLACNTVHTAADRIESAVDLPFLHIVDPTARKVQQRGGDAVRAAGKALIRRGDPDLVPISTVKVTEWGCAN